MRVLLVEDIPKKLWSDDVLHLPEDSVDCYVAELTNLGLIEDAKKGTDKKSIHGGCTEAETLEHFAYRFVVSAGRVEFSTIAPGSALSLVPISNALLSTFSDGEITLLDIPCGHGSSTISLLATLAALRKAKVIPTLPLTVTIMGGDCSKRALEIFESMMQRLEPTMKKCGVEINWRTQLWDATRADSTAKLVDEWFVASGKVHEYVVYIANFSGALKEAGFFDEFKPSLEQILGRLHDKKSTLIWVEPISDTVKSKFLPKILDFFKKRISWFSTGSSNPTFMSGTYSLKDCLNGKVFSSGLGVQRFERR